MASKAALKGIKAAIDANQFEKAAKHAEELVDKDKDNYNALLFLGFAREKLGKFDDAEKALLSALAVRPEDLQALKGLIGSYEKQGANKLDAYHNTLVRLASIYAAQDDREHCQAAVDKYETFAKRHGTRAQYRRALELILPTSDLYPVLEGRVYPPSLTYQRILESSEEEEEAWIKSQIADRRTRLGANLAQVSAEVKYEAASIFNLEEKYQNLIDWTQDDDVRHELEEQLLRRAYENLIVTPIDAKAMQRDRVLTAANGMVIIKHKYALAWSIAIEWVDAESIVDWDVGIIREYVEFFPDEGLSKIFQGFLDSTASPFPAPIHVQDETEQPQKLTEADQLIIMMQGLELSPDSMLAHRIMAQTYLHLEEHQSAAEIARKARQLYVTAQTHYALNLQDSIDGVDLILGKALTTYQSPRHHPEARKLFDDVLRRKPKSTEALLGVGLILEEDEDYGEAVQFLRRAADRDPDNLRIQLECAWCNALGKDLEGGLKELEDVLSELGKEKTPDLSMKSVTLYRIAYCKWQLDPSAAARRDKSGSYRYLIESLKANSAYAPAYTLLGIYFQDYSKSKQRARVALQKAFELSTSELVAAERLASQFANNGEWDLVELVAQRVIESGKAKPAPGSKKKSYSWPYAAMGIVQMNRQQYVQAVVSFQAALRISPGDYNSWVGLGESYHHSGRYVAASRAFSKAQSIEHGLSVDKTWFAQYMLANVQREIGAFEGAIAAYESVLAVRDNEYGVLIALLQSCTEYGWTRIAQGHYGQAVELARKAIGVAMAVVKHRTDVFNLWRSLGDACSIIGKVQGFVVSASLVDVEALLANNSTGLCSTVSDIDEIEMADLQDTSNVATRWLKASILCHKRSVFETAHDFYAQAVAWYNLGWAEHTIYTHSYPSIATETKKHSRFLKAAVRCFKKAIELEAGNADYWNALGVVTMTLSPKVAQHSFVRSLHLNDSSAKTWTNLGTFYLVKHDNQLANEAFTRAQSADPEYAAAWIGQGLIAMLTGKLKDARALFTHAFEIADSSFISAKRHYATSAFDHLLSHPDLPQNIHGVLQPLFALRQLHVLQPSDMATSHLLSMCAERVGEYTSSILSLEAVCNAAEAEYEHSESHEHLIRYAQAKSDLARAQLGQHDLGGAIENAETAISLSEEELDPKYVHIRQQWRLSCHITLGLAQSHKGDLNSSIKAFRVALEESHHDPDVVCMLAQVLWAKGEDGEREAARNQLFACVEAHPEHVQAILLLGVTGLLDDEEDVLTAVEDDLKALRMSQAVNESQKLKITRVLGGIISAKPEQQTVAAADAMANIMLSPAQPHGWLELAHTTDDEYVPEMALKAAKTQVPPNGDLGAEELAKAFTNCGRQEDALVAHVLAPWNDATKIISN